VELIRLEHHDRVVGELTNTDQVDHRLGEPRPGQSGIQNRDDQHPEHPGGGAGVDAVACRMLPGFAWIVGANWLVTPYGEPDPAVNDELAATLGGELLACS
jgi:hypothetical protein